MTVITSPLAEKVIGCAIDVHRVLGPGLLESAYEFCLTHEFQLSAVNFRRQVAVPVVYKGTHLDCGYRVDFVVDDVLLVEIKSIDKSKALALPGVKAVLTADDLKPLNLHYMPTLAGDVQAEGGAVAHGRDPVSRSACAARTTTAIWPIPSAMGARSR